MSGDLAPRSSAGHSATRSVVIVAFTALAAFVTYFVMPSDMNELARRTVSIFIVAAVLWATEALPLFATSFVIIGLQIIFLASDGGLAQWIPSWSAWPGEPARPVSLKHSAFLAPLASSVIVLFLGGFLLAGAVQKHGLDRVLAGKCLRPLSRSPALLLVGVLCITAFFSMWMSNTATTAMMLAVLYPILQQLPRGSRYQRALILAVPFGANIGGIGTPIGTPPNAIALANLRGAGHDLGFVQWMMLAVPLELLLLAVAAACIWLMLRPERGLKIGELAAPAHLSRGAWVTSGVLVLAIVLWLSAPWTGLDEAATAMLAAAALTALGALDRHDIKHIDWDVLVLMWGGLALGNAMEATGLVRYVVELPIAQAQGWLLAAMVVLLTLALSTFMSNTATAALMVPTAMALSTTEGLGLAILVGLASSFAMAMPISTPPNAMAFATGMLPVRDMLRVGGAISVACVIVLLVGYRLMLPLVLGGH